MTNINTFQGDVFIHEYIKHSGDDNNLFGFSGTDTFKIATAGVDAIKVDADQNVDITGLIRHIGDENNLFGFSGADTFKIATGGTDRLTINASGKVGIATASPVNALDVHVGTAAYSGIHLSTTNTGFAKLIGNASDGGHNSIVKTGDTGIVFSPDSSASSTASEKGFYIAPWANATSGLKILDNGYVGIGKAVPTQKLDVDGYAKFGNVCIKTSGPLSSGTGGVYTGISMDGGTGGGVVLFFVSINSSGSDATAAWIFALRKYHSGAGAHYPYPYRSTLFSNAGVQTPNITLYTDSGGILKYTFGQNRNTKWSAYDM